MKILCQYGIREGREVPEGYMVSVGRKSEVISRQEATCITPHAVIQLMMEQMSSGYRALDSCIMFWTNREEAWRFVHKVPCPTNEQRLLLDLDQGVYQTNRTIGGSPRGCWILNPAVNTWRREVGIHDQICHDLNGGEHIFRHTVITPLTTFAASVVLDTTRKKLHAFRLVNRKREVFEERYW